MSSWLISLITNYGLIIIFVLMAAENACLPIPSGPSRWAMLAWALLVGLVIRKHADNLNRLFRGAESPLWGAKKVPHA